MEQPAPETTDDQPQGPRPAEQLGSLPVPTPVDVKEAETALRMMQQMLGYLNANHQGDSDDFKALLANYRHLQESLKIVKELTAKPADRKPAPEKTARKPVAGQAVVMGPAGKPPEQVRGSTPPPLRVPGATPPLEPAPAPWAEPEAPPAAPRLPLPRFAEAFGPPGRMGVISMGEEVGYLQRVLTHLGYTVAETEEYDQATVLAVRKFQQANGLEPSDLVNADMRELLNQAVSG